MAKTETVRGFSALKSQIEKEKEGLKGVDDNIRKLTGRDPSFALNVSRGERGRENRDQGRLIPENRRNIGVDVNRRRLENFSDNVPVRSQVGEYRGRFVDNSARRRNSYTDDRYDAENEDVGIKRRVGDAFSRLGPAFGDGAQRSPSPSSYKPTLPSSVRKPPSAEAKSRQDCLNAQSADKVGKARNKRMFGLLMGTLQKFQSDSQKESYVIEKRKEIEQKLSVKEEEERQELRQERQNLFRERKARQGRIRRMAQKLDIVEVHQIWESEVRKMMNFVQTRAKPHIFFLPKIMNASTEKALKRSQQILEDKIKKRKENVEEEIEALMVLDEKDEEVSKKVNTKHPANNDGATKTTSLRKGLTDEEANEEITQNPDGTESAFDIGHIEEQLSKSNEDHNLPANQLRNKWKNEVVESDFAEATSLNNAQSVDNKRPADCKGQNNEFAALRDVSPISSSSQDLSKEDEDILSGTETSLPENKQSQEDGEENPARVTTNKTVKYSNSESDHGQNDEASGPAKKAVSTDNKDQEATEKQERVQKIDLSSINECSSPSYRKRSLSPPNSADQSYKKIHRSRSPIALKGSDSSEKRKASRQTDLSSSPSRPQSKQSNSVRQPNAYNPMGSSRSLRRRSRSPRRKSRSPKRKSRSPRRKSRSPRRKSRSPRRKSRSPRRHTRSPRRHSRSPRRQLRSLRRSSPAKRHQLTSSSRRRSRSLKRCLPPRVQSPTSQRPSTPPHASTQSAEQHKRTSSSSSHSSVSNSSSSSDDSSSGED